MLSLLVWTSTFSLVTLLQLLLMVLLLIHPQQVHTVVSAGHENGRGNMNMNMNMNMNDHRVANPNVQAAPPPVTFELNGIASSYDGTRTAAAVWASGIYVSTDFGLTWIKSNAPLLFWTCIAMDRTGQYLAAGAWSGGGLYISADFGKTWVIKLSGTFDLNSIAYTMNGGRLVAAMNNDGVYMSIDYGKSWQKTSASNGNVNNWGAVASCGQGKHLAVAQRGGGIYVSSDFGTTWIRSLAPNGNWYCLKADSTGQYIAGGITGGEIYISANYGESWVTSSNPNKKWTGVSVQICP
jgi:photosystem II stability/assembly factor-like uncharacterized protein